MNIKVIASVFALFFFTMLASCSSRTSEISAANISKEEYRHLSCEQLVDEAENLKKLVVICESNVNDLIFRDGLVAISAVFIYPPAMLLASAGNKDVSDLLADARGRRKTVRYLMRDKECY